MEDGLTTAFRYDSQGRLVGRKDPQGPYISLADDDNIRVSATAGGVTTSYLLDKNRPYAQVLEEYEDGSSVASYAYGLDLIEQDREGVESYYLVDGLGSTRVLLDETGDVAAAYSYDAYGNLVGEPGAVENAYRFAGEQWDEELGQYYLRQRYYDPTTGRFTRRDTWEGDHLEPVTLNKHIYANADPVNGIDPSGLYTIAEANAAFNIANTLNQAQLDNGMRFLAMAAGGDEPTPSSLGWDTLFALGLTASVPLFGLAIATSKRLGKIIGKVAKIAGRHKNLECVPCANEIKNFRFFSTWCGNNR